MMLLNYIKIRTGVDTVWVKFKKVHKYQKADLDDVSHMPQQGITCEPPIRWSQTWELLHPVIIYDSAVSQLLFSNSAQSRNCIS